MKNDAILVNISRGGIVDQDALYDALKNGQIHAAGNEKVY
jgi:glyoxylate reductase